jgi:Uma2 family endonuclease
MNGIATVSAGVSAAEFEAIIAAEANRERHFELIDGEVVEKMPTQKHGVMSGSIITEINLYLRQHPIGYAGVETRFRPEGDESNDRIPDVAFVRHPSAGAGPLVESGPVIGMPDLAVEVQSPDDTLKSMRDKADFYLAHGSRMVWLFYDKRLVEVLTPTERQLLTEDDVLDGGEVLPGFRVRVGDLYPPAG